MFHYLNQLPGQEYLSYSNQAQAAQNCQSHSGQQLARKQSMQQGQGYSNLSALQQAAHQYNQPYIKVVDLYLIAYYRKYIK